MGGEMSYIPNSEEFIEIARKNAHIFEPEMSPLEAENKLLMYTSSVIGLFIKGYQAECEEPLSNLEKYGHLADQG